MLWFALHFPFLPLEALAPGSSPEASACPSSPPAGEPRSGPPAPAAIVARGRILAADQAALAAGVRAGQRLSTALGLAPGLTVRERDQPREAAALETLACWAGRFTPQVSLAPPATLLLEIGGCLRLFAGAKALVAVALAGSRAQGYTPIWAVAPTPLAATWLAWGGLDALCCDGQTCAAALAALPCTVPAWPAAVEQRLIAFGAATLGDLRRLPAAGLRRRIGSAAVDELLRAWGELPDPRPAFVFPEHFVRRLELPARVEAAPALAFAGRRLLAALAGWLDGRQRLARSCRLDLFHDGGGFSTLELRPAEPSADEDRLHRLLRERLDRLHLSAPVEALALEADDWIPRPGESASLFDRPPAGEGVLACLERLQARLGEEAVHGLATVPDYRPECAGRERPPGETSRPVQPPGGARPLWLLPRPERLPEGAGRPCWHGPLTLKGRPERLESGWWDGGEPAAAGDVRRDYFVARNPRGQWLWIYRDREGWFLQGVFG